jgi:7-cyano-7-deazaguanosine (preQ0) biosynthesis protein QueE
MIPIAEIFGPTIQGEGPRAGRLCAFIRTGGCNLACSYCDTPYTWDWKNYDMHVETTRMSAKQILAALPTSVDEVVITGGEPMIHQQNGQWVELLMELNRRNIQICVETNGTVAPTDVTQRFVCHYSISPKLSNSGTHKKGQDPTLTQWPVEIKHSSTGSTACLKYVVLDKNDVRAAVAHADAHEWPRRSVWMMPEGVDIDILTERFPVIATAALREGVNACQRLQIYAFGNTRGT